MAVGGVDHEEVDVRVHEGAGTLERRLPDAERRTDAFADRGTVCSANNRAVRRTDAVTVEQSVARANCSAHGRADAGAIEQSVPRANCSTHSSANAGAVERSDRSAVTSAICRADTVPDEC